MNLQYRIHLLHRLGQYLLSNEEEWVAVCEKAERENPWFTQEFIQSATYAIAKNYLDEMALKAWIRPYSIQDVIEQPFRVGMVMAGNIPLVGFHDWLCCFVAGHKAIIKLSSKDKVLLPHILQKMTDWEPDLQHYFELAEFLKGCDAYIATGSNNSAGYFDYYFGKYPNIIRRNRSSVAILQGKETKEELEKLADDVHLYFGLGCRNVTKLLVPRDYDFVPLLDAFKKYQQVADHHKFKNNYDYQLALHILNKKFYMTSGTVLLVEDASIFAPISQLHYEYYDPGEETDLLRELAQNPNLQTLVGRGYTPFGQSQTPSLQQYADGVDTLAFLTRLSK